MLNHLRLPLHSALTPWPIQKQLDFELQIQIRQIDVDSDNKKQRPMMIQCVLRAVERVGETGMCAVTWNREGKSENKVKRTQMQMM
jgi:hypothetical protein